MKGGYQVINFGGAVLDATPRTFKDAYKKASAGKAVLIEDVRFSTQMPTVSGFASAIRINDGSYVVTIIASGANGIQAVTITVTSEDVVTAEFKNLAEAD